MCDIGVVDANAMQPIRPVGSAVQVDQRKLQNINDPVDAAARRRRKVKGNMDIELAVDAMELAGHVDQIVLFSGAGDFRPLVEALQRRGVRITVVSTIASQPPMIADELRRQADLFTDLVELRSKIERPASERAPRA
ncbi:uncharacterized LabA/DUF88 family protein [Bradyrhizobium niftali]